MRMKQIETIYFWLFFKPFAIKGLIESLSKTFSGKVCCVILGDQPKEREETNTEQESESISYLYINKKNFRKNIKLLISEIHNSVHFFNGYKGKMNYIIKEVYKKKNNNNTNYVWMEKTNSYGRFAKIKEALRYVENRYYYYSINPKVRAIFPISSVACSQYIHYGWNKNKVYPFFYCPKSYNFENATKSFDNKLKCLYVGRLTEEKGVDLLIYSFDNLDVKNVSLDIIGNYGSLADNVKIWAKNRVNINMHGTLPIDKVYEIMPRFDLILIPSHVEGWNVNVNIAVLTNTPILTTSNNPSSEVVLAFEGGEVTEDTPMAFHKALKQFIVDSDKLSYYRNNLILLSNKLEPRTLAKYVMKCLDHSLNLGVKPNPPWL